MSYLDELANAIREEVPAHRVPDGGGVEDLFRLYALLARIKGEAVTAEDVHDAWAVWMLRRNGDHKSIKPFKELDAETRRADVPYVKAIRKVARAGHAL